MLDPIGCRMNNMNDMEKYSRSSKVIPVEISAAHAKLNIDAITWDEEYYEIYND